MPADRVLGTRGEGYADLDPYSQGGSPPTHSLQIPEVSVQGTPNVVDCARLCVVRRPKEVSRRDSAVTSWLC